MAQGSYLRDDFSGASVDTSIWTAAGSVTEGSGFVTLTGAVGTCTLVSKAPYLYEKGATLTMNCNLPRTVLSGHNIGFYYYDGTNNRFLTFSNSWNWNANIFVNIYCDDVTSVTFDTGIACTGIGTKMTFIIKWLTTGYAEFWINGSLVYTTTHVLSNTYKPWVQFGNIYDNGVQLQADYVQVDVPSLLSPPFETTKGSTTAVRNASSY